MTSSYRKMPSLYSLFARNRIERANEPAFLVAVGDRSMPITWRQFSDDVISLGTIIRRYVGQNETVGILGENSYEWFTVHAACIFGGAIVVPIDPSLDPSAMAERLAFVGARFCAHSALYADKAAAAAKLLPSCQFILFGSTLSDDLLADGKKAINEGDNSYLDSLPDEDRTAEIIFTSGTTSKPRGVEISHRNLAVFSATAAEILPVKPGDATLMLLPLHHVFGLASAYFSLLHGAALGICPDYRRIFDAVQRFRAKYLFLVPALAEILAAKISSHGASAAEALESPLDWILTGGAPLAQRTARKLQSLGINVLEGYGLTETASLFSLAPYDAPHPGTAGRVSPFCETRVSDAGELQIRGPNIMKGYLKEPKLTAAAFDDGWFKTGDVGTIDEEGYVHILGRRNRTIVLSSGKKVAPEELEAELTKLEGILEAVVSGEGETRIITAEVFAETDEQTVRERIAGLNKTLPLFKRIRRIVVRSEPFPRTASGKIKIDKAAR